MIKKFTALAANSFKKIMEIIYKSNNSNQLRCAIGRKIRVGFLTESLDRWQPHLLRRRSGSRPLIPCYRF